MSLAEGQKPLQNRKISYVRKNMGGLELGPVKLVFSIISGLALVGSLLTWLLYEDYSMLPGFVMMGVTAALLAWAYDLLLGLLSPADMVNTL
ncbi:hypothetical protein ISD75_33800 [Pseudomonas aeruginosa]|uniref:hypothetical protein n=1 Tax=Pseudomonas aeruginosa TaxID=287 RepID=UPI00191FEDF0|nr:hypothetical protein [Pseudomonas aeruginosa]MBX5683497.1 hypothetical protein [Pseudomonas aeruginosa]MBX5756971.1 hypothetical protein [Pseudomonas aeruginosa]MBX6078213.1 hypothetical protein [Pseudomonas aeruginosa]MBX6121852.1 hypothetical protein [Pseudomonas aeruginosa]MBX6253902.1 hypothetical protein [Pseudomonas aeruginosa]